MHTLLRGVIPGGAIDVERTLGLCSKISSARILHRLIITRSNYLDTKKVRVI